MKKITISSFILLTLLAFTACSNAENEEITSPEEVKTTAESGDTTTAEKPEATKSTPGQIHLDFPDNLAVSAKTGEYILAPSKSTIDTAISEKNKGAVVIFHNAEMLTPGDKESKIKDLVGNESMMPNSLIIPIKTAQSVTPGDIVLTWWQSGSGMTRAIVVEGGTPTAPNIRYLDISIETDVETLKPNSFHKLSEPFEPGTTVAVKDGTEYLSETVINISGEKVLTSGFAGVMYVRNKADSTPVPVKPDLKVGDKVYAPIIGSFRESVIKSIDASIGMVEVEYEWGGQKSTEKIPFGDILSTLPT